VDLAYGRKLPRLLTDEGLVEVTADAYLPVAHPAMGALDFANTEQVRDALLGQGLATADEIDTHLEAIRPGLGLASPPLVSAWGRRPHWEP
jgi:hypothetical protein